VCGCDEGSRRQHQPQPPKEHTPRTTHSPHTPCRPPPAWRDTRTRAVAPHTRDACRHATVGSAHGQAVWCLNRGSHPHTSRWCSSGERGTVIRSGRTLVRGPAAPASRWTLRRRHRCRAAASCAPRSAPARPSMTSSRCIVRACVRVCHSACVCACVVVCVAQRVSALVCVFLGGGRPEQRHDARVVLHPPPWVRALAVS
jgi:hypothetical protein